MFNTLLIRLGWYTYRKDQGHPITLWRALFSPMPRFSSYEKDEEGCPTWAKTGYNLLDK